MCVAAKAVLVRNYLETFDLFGTRRLNLLQSIQITPLNSIVIKASMVINYIDAVLTKVL